MNGSDRGTPPRALVLAAFAAIYGIWGSTYLAIAVAVETLPPLLMVSVRCLIAGAVLLGWVLLRGEKLPGRAAWLTTARQAVLLFGAYGLVAWGEQRVASGAAAVLGATSPLFVVMLEPRVRTRLAALAAVATGLVGVLLLASPWRSGGLDPLGTLAMVGASALWGMGAARAQSASVPGSALMATSMELLTGAAMLFVGALFLGELGAVPHVSTTSALAVGYLIVFGSIVAYTAFHWLLQVASPSLVSTHAYVNPIIALALGAMLHGEVVGGASIAATGLVLGSVGVLALATR